jgi:hypothetical protein
MPIDSVTTAAPHTSTWVIERRGGAAADVALIGTI